MCKASHEAGGQLRCSADSRAHFQRSVDRVADLERQWAQLTEQIEDLKAQRARVEEAIDDSEPDDLYEAITSAKPRVITTAKGECVKVGFSIRNGAPWVLLNWRGSAPGVQWASWVDLDAKSAHVLADTMTAPPEVDWEVRRVTPPHNPRYDFLCSLQSEADPAAINLMVIDHSDPDAADRSRTLKLDADSVREVSEALRMAADSFTAAHRD